MIEITAQIKIMDGVDFFIDKRNIISFEYGVFDRSDINLPSYGILSNTGNIVFNDTDGQIATYADQLVLTSGKEVICYIKETISDIQIIIARTQTDNWDYDNNNRVVTVELKDDLEEWQNIQVPEIFYDPRTNVAITGETIYNRLYNITSAIGGNKYRVKNFSFLDSATKTILSNTRVLYDIRKSASLWEQWDKLCKLCSLYMYKSSNGEAECSYTLGR